MSARRGVDAPKSPITEEVPLHLRIVVDAEGETLQPFVRCPRQDETIDALACMGCESMRDLEWSPRRGGAVTCEVDRAAPVVDGRADLAELAIRDLARDLVGPVTVCVAADLPIGDLKRIVAEKGVRSVAVVDDERKLVGLVSRSDLTTAGLGCVGDIMSSPVHGLPEDAPVGYLIALMAFDDVSEVPVVADDGSVIGICHALDVLRWVASGLGYRVTKKAQPTTTGA